MNAGALIDSTEITEVWRALGGPEPKGGRAQAFYRDGKSDRSVSLNPNKNTWYDHGIKQGGGVLALIEAVTGCDRKAAAQWLANHHGVTLENQSPADVAAWRRRRELAEAQAADLAAWRQEERRRLIHERNHHWDVSAIAMACGRILLAEGSAAPESAWDLVWRHAVDDLRGDQVQAHLDYVEAMSPAELAEYRGRFQRVAA